MLRVPPGSEVEEQPFTDSPEDYSDVPIPVLINTLTGQSPDGFLISTDGSLERNSMAECEGIGEESPEVALGGRPKRARHPRVLFGGLELWEEH